MTLPGYQHEKLSEALRDAFGRIDRFEQFVKYRFNKNLYDITIPQDLKDLAFSLISEADREGWVKNLVLGARLSNPGNQKLISFCEDFFPDTLFPNISLPPELLKRDSREKIIRETNSFLDVGKWVEKLSEIQAQVCRIEFPTGKAQGTGFLIAPNVIITNFHVMEDLIKGTHTYSDVILRFDYKNLRDNKSSTGKEYRLKEEWLIDKSSYLSDAENLLPLDYTLVRVDDEPGNSTIGEPGSPARGWINLPTEPYQFLPNTPLFIVQHPEGKPLKLALDTDAIIDVNENGTIVRYKTNTEPGSSGSPCFNSNWDLVALHHMGEEGKYNAGTPFSAICKRLEERGLLKPLQKGQAI
ncbi:trypsin-like peptidase domain-containing protein [Nostoc punctiforme FACHB-252]|uniref:Serine protease n=1 Tax=Nostoc punctiforme FACHB-252 TaxID=1357509 RepID=A0ABR8HK36_NOSPU|nr:trypsin-like peptidase domain-containing protein [Nostoc punctiforme]MBD2616215.1 trypsin-like peptidase domain-containing protein [Nostoc punctiforme FACHB-252]